MFLIIQTLEFVSNYKMKRIKKTQLLILGGILLIILCAVSAYSLTKNQTPVSQQNKKTVTVNPNITPIPLRLSFEPSTIKLTSPGEQKIQSDINLNVGPQDLRSIDIVISCDPKRVKNLTLTQKRDRYSSLSYAFAPTQAIVNTTTCEAKLSLEIPKDNPEQRGSGIVASLSATITGNTPTEITILPISMGNTDNPGIEFQTQRVNLELTQ